MFDIGLVWSWIDIIQTVLFNQIYFRGIDRSETTMNYFQQVQNQESNYQPPHQQQQQNYEFSTNQPFSYTSSANHATNHQYNHSAPHNTDQEFDQFEEDQVTKRIRLQQSKIQSLLKQKSEHEWNLKQKRSETGRSQLQEFLNKKQEQRVARAAQNIQRQRETREDLAKLNVQAGWRKVISNINLRIGQRKGPKDIIRMREAILHKRQDEGK